MAQAAAPESPFDAFHTQLHASTVRPRPIQNRDGVWHGQEFVLCDKLRSWLVGPPASPAPTNLDMLLSAASNSDYVSDLQVYQVATGESACLLVFCILIELDQAVLIRDFYQNDIVDRLLPIDLYNLEIVISRIAKHRKIVDWDRWGKELAYKFDQKQWKYRPVKFMYEDNKSWTEKQVFPFMGKHLITVKGGTSFVYEVTVPSVLVDKRLRMKIAENDVEIDGILCCHFALKVFKDGHKHIFEDETKAYQVLSRSSGENNGMLSYLGRFSSIVEGKDRHNILLEYANNDLEGHFRRSPPFLPDAILRFWKELAPVVFALSQLHEFEIDNSIKPAQKYEGWHADIKPDNILRVNEEFKLADPGFAKFQKKQLEETPHASQIFSGGTATFGAPERYSKGEKVADPRSSDMWSIGCVLSESATWVVLGNLGVKTFRDVRINAIERLTKTRGTKFSSSLERLESSDFFHDGEEVLPEVMQWHAMLRTLLRPTDNVTKRILELVDKCLFLANPQDRPNARHTYEALKNFFKRAEQSRKEPQMLISAALHTAIENALQRESDELQDYVNSQSNEERQADKDNPHYLQIRGPSSSSSLTVRRPSFDHTQSLSTSVIRDLPGRTSARSASTHHRHQSSSGGDPRPHNIQVDPRNSVGSITADPARPSSNRETVFDTFYLTTQQKTKQVFGLVTKKRTPPRDERLGKSVKERDLVFLVDNGQTMLEHWHEVTFVLEMLYSKCTKLDEDGIDLHFTGGSAKVSHAKGKDGLKEIRAKMLESSESRPTEDCHTDMASPLTTLLGAWLTDYKKKRDKQKSLTIIVLTDGKWIKNRYQPDAVDKTIMKFDGQLREHAGLTPERSVSIQFVSFGNDPDALHRLDRLDNDLKYKGVADIVDTEPSNGDVYKMILGSIDEAMDALNDPPQSRLFSSPPQSPLQSPAQSSMHTLSPSSSGSSYVAAKHPSRGSGSSIDAVFAHSHDIQHIHRTMFD